MLEKSYDGEKIFAVWHFYSLFHLAKLRDLIYGKKKLCLWINTSPPPFVLEKLFSIYNSSETHTDKQRQTWSEYFELGQHLSQPTNFYGECKKRSWIVLSN